MAFLPQHSLSRGPKRSQSSCTYSQKGSQKIPKASQKAGKYSTAAAKIPPPARVVKKRGAFFGRRCQELDFQGSGVPRELPRGTPGAPTGSTRERSPWITLLGLPSWVVSPGIALQGLLSWGFSLLDCSPLDCALLGLLSWDCSAGIFPQGLLSWDCFIILHF